jgi:hypothetical protein
MTQTSSSPFLTSQCVRIVGVITILQRVKFSHATNAIALFLLQQNKTLLSFAPETPKIYTKILFIPFISMNYDDYNLDDDPFDACDGTRFARSGSALRAASKRNPRSLPCGTCGRPNMLTPADKHRGYQCDICARQAEQGW